LQSGGGIHEFSDSQFGKLKFNYAVVLFFLTFLEFSAEKVDAF